jgi:septation ring formation regulator EzrA
MAQVTIDEERLGELIQDEVQKHFRLTFEDMDEMRRSPAASVIRLETHFDTIEKNMATKADVANLRTELKAEIAELRERFGKLEANQKLMLGLMLSTFGAVLAALVKLFFLS